MQRDTMMGGNWIGQILKLIVLCVVVGIVLHTLGITPENFFYRIADIARNIYNLGFDAFNWALRYFLLGAAVVVPIWLITRAVGMARRKS